MKARAWGVALALSTVPLVASAADNDLATRLAQRLAGYGGSIPATVYVGAVPPGLDATVPLPQATLLGSVVLGGGRLQQTANSAARSGPAPVQLYYEFAPGRRDAAATAYRAALVAAGYTMRDMPFPAQQQGGFGSSFAFPQLWCPKDDTAGQLTVQFADAEPAGVNVTVQPASMGSGRTAFGCGPARPTAQQVVGMVPKTPLPRFTTPDGVTVLYGGPATDGTTTAARLSSTLGIDAVFAAYAHQLTAAGWMQSATARGSATLRSATFTLARDGAPWIASLILYNLDATHYIALTDVSDARNDPGPAQLRTVITGG